MFSNQFLAIVAREGYYFLHENRCDGKIVSLLPFRQRQRGLEYLARVEVCPAHGLTPEVCGITGGVDPGTSVVETARHELLEEAGYRVELAELIDLGQVYPSKSADTVAYLFGVDVTDRTAETATGDGSRWEQGSSVLWVTKQQGLLVQDPLFVTCIARLHARRTHGRTTSHS